MTVIAWDGKTLAADKLATNSGLRRTTTKLKRVGQNLIAVSGDADKSRQLIAWFEAGAKPETFPPVQLTGEYAGMLVVEPSGRLLKYEQTPYPFEIEDSQFAMGSGRDFALAALHMGADSVRAVEVACHFEIHCGGGIDTLTFEGTH